MVAGHAGDHVTQVVAFRADASLQMGTGHVMRGLTLADALKGSGAECHFICREHPGNLVEHIRSKGYPVHALPCMAFAREAAAPVHATWLGASQEQDAAACADVLRELQPDWLIVDHYGLDARWESVLKPHYRKLLVIDDLADRPHQCDLLLDQTFGREPEDYKPWVRRDCTLLCGSQFALLRPEFAALRPYSLRRREQAKLEHLLITMGGVDQGNATSQVLQALKHSELPDDCRITVVMGATAPWLAEVRQQAAQMPWPTMVLVGVSEMAQLMADSDLAIGAAGSTSWERCCLGLPTVMAVLADNQQKVARGLELAGAVHVLPGSGQFLECLPPLLRSLALSPEQRVSMSQAAQSIVDGRGVATVIQHLEL